MFQPTKRFWRETVSLLDVMWISKYPMREHTVGKKFPANITISSIDCEQSLFFFRFSRGSAHARASGEAARRAKRGRQPEKKKRDCPLSQGQWNTRWPHNAKYDWLMREALTSNCQEIETIDKLMMAEALQECLSRFPSRISISFPISHLHQSRAWPFACLAFCSTDYRKKRDCS